MRRRVPGVCSARGVIQGVASIVHRARPQEFGRRLDARKYNGRLDARGKSHVLDDAKSSLDHTVLLWAVGVSEVLLNT